MTRSRTLLQEEIVRAAAICFGEHGYRATTLETIAAKVGISKVTLYTCVSSKEELLCQVFEQAVESSRSGLRQIVNQDLPADEKLRRLIRYQVNLLTSQLPLLTVFFSEESGLPPDMARRVAREKREYDRTVKKVVQEGISDRRVRDLPPTLLVFGLLGMCNWLYKWYDPRGKLAPDEIAAIFTDLLERGYLPRQGEAKADPLVRTLRRVEEQITRLESRLARRRPAKGERRGKGRKAPRA